MEYVSVKTKSIEWGVSPRRIQVLASEGRIKGATKIGGVWLIPENTVYPVKDRASEDIYFKETVKNRRKLKSLLNKLWLEYEGNLDKNKFRYYVLSTLHSALLSKSLKDNQDFNSYDLANHIYNWFLESETEILDKNNFNDIFVLLKEYLDMIKGDTINILSWAYQYLNPILLDNDEKYTKTQFFTEQYMIDFLLEDFQNNYYNGLIFDPCCGGGNMLTLALEEMVNLEDTGSMLEQLHKNLPKLIGYDIDPSLSIIAVLNIRLKCIELLQSNKEKIDFDTWDQLSPSIFFSDEPVIGGSLDESHTITNRLSGESIDSAYFNNNVNILITNPPFETVKGMNLDLNEYLKQNYPNSNSDTCVAFINRAGDFLEENGTALMVVQNSWMFLDSFERFRNTFLRKYLVNKIVDLGSGAFLDITGEKSSVSLLVFNKSVNKKRSNNILYRNLKHQNIEGKINGVFENGNNDIYLKQNSIFNNEKARLDFLNIGSIREYYYSGDQYGKYGNAMQGTSTGNNKKLVGYFWEHFGDKDWILSSKGGGYSRWQGLNRYVVKWGKEGEYIRKEKGSAIRNAQHFIDTEIVYSDTGTSGLNCRLLLPHQIFIASGPGIRLETGEDKFVHLAVLNSRLSSFYMRILSPKLTISAGYISKLPVSDELFKSSYLKSQALICVKAKVLQISNRPNNFEYNTDYQSTLSNDLEIAVNQLIMNDLNSELMKLEGEYNIDTFILQKSNISTVDIKLIDNEIGTHPMKNTNSELPELHHIDKEWQKITDTTVTLKKSRYNKKEIGSDGVLELMSKKFKYNPKNLLVYIEKNISDFKLIRKKYKNLILHNYVLDIFKYSTIDGIKNQNNISMSEICFKISKRFSLEVDDISYWIAEEFNTVHKEIFYSKPFLFIDVNKSEGYIIDDQ